MQLSCLLYCMPVRVAQSTVTTLCSWTPSTSGTSGSCSTSNGRIGFQISKSLESRHDECTCSTQEILYEVDRSWVSHVWWAPAKKALLWWSENRQKLQRRSKETLQRHSEGLLEVLWHQPWHMGGSYPSSYYLVQPDQHMGNCLWGAYSPWGHPKVPAAEEQSKKYIHILPAVSPTMFPLQQSLLSTHLTNKPSPHSKHHCVPLISGHCYLQHWTVIIIKCQTVSNVKSCWCIGLLGCGSL